MESESQDFDQGVAEISETVVDTSSVFSGNEFFLPLVILTVILGGLTIFYLLKLKSK